MKYILITAAIFCLCFFSCSKSDELSVEELESFSAQGLEEILAKTISRPWQGEEFVPGRLRGIWYSVVMEDPKSFNLLIAEQDSSTNTIVASMHDYFLDYDVVAREWKGRIAEPEIIVDEENDSLQVVYTLRDDLYWSYYNSNRKVKVTSDDVIFWYNEISGDPNFQSSGYYQQFLVMPDGSDAHIDMLKIDDRRFAFHFPRIIADPLISTNMDFGPRHVYEPAKREGFREGFIEGFKKGLREGLRKGGLTDGITGSIYGSLEGGIEGMVDAVRNLFSVAVDPQIIPSMGEWFLVEYTPGQRLVYKRNPDYWRKDANGLSIPYVEENIIRIIPDENTQLLLFRNGETESYRLRPEDLDGLVNRGDGSYTVFNSEGSLSAAFWAFNQNPANSGKPKYDWFIQKEFRQAMSCLLNRDRLNAQVYRGLAEPKLNLFPEPNPYYNPHITLQYLYDTQKAETLLSSIGIKKDSKGIMRDSKNRPLEFDITIRSESSMYQDTASIIRDELSKIGIKVNIRIVDFQKQVEQLFNTFDWDSTLIALSGSNIFPSQGSNVWPSEGNLHLWNPNQQTPATDWEARIDYLYNEGMFTIDKYKAQIIWDEFQSILMEQCPIIHLMRSRGFWALNNRWDFTNVYYDNLNGAETSYTFLR